MRAVVVGAVAAAVVVSACGFPTQGSPQQADLDEPASQLTIGQDLPVGKQDVVVWFVHDDTLVPADRSVPEPATALSAVGALTSGVSASESASGLRSAIPDPAMVTDASVAGGTAVVTLAPEFLDIPAGDQVLALAQIVYTLTDLRGVGRVRFEIDGEPVVVPLPDGGSTEDSVAREDFVELL